MKSSSLYILIALSGLVFGAEIVASHVTKSLALLISSYHMLYNIMSLILLVISRRMSKGKTLKNTFGWARVKILGMMISMLSLSALSFATIVEAIQTMVHASHDDTEPKYPLLILGLGVTNFCVNVLCFYLIGGYTHHQGCYLVIHESDAEVSSCVASDDEMNDVCSTYQTNNSAQAKVSDVLQSNSLNRTVMNDHRILDISRDISSSLSVIACGTIVYAMNGLVLKYIDSILASASVVVLLTTTYPFIRESALILLQSIPTYIDVIGLSERMKKQFPAVENIHDFHIWRLTTSEVIATVHIMLHSPFSYITIADPLVQFFKKEGIDLVTIQPEFSKEDFLNSKSECILQCSHNNNCGAMTCCGPSQSHEDSKVRHRPVINKDLEQNAGDSVILDVIVSTDKSIEHGSPQSDQGCDTPLLPKYDLDSLITAAVETKL